MLDIADNYPMSNLTTLQIGGPARKFVVVKTQQNLAEAIQFAKQNNLSCLIIGRGSNLLVADEGVDSLVIKNEISGINDTPPRSNFVTPRRWPHGLLRGENEGVTLKVKSGTLLQQLVDYTIEHGLSGLQKLTGIPGTVGGAVYGNAGAYGQTISDHIVNVVVINSPVIPAYAFDSEAQARRAGIQLSKHGSRIKTRTVLVQVKYGMTKQECHFNYRDSIFKKTHDIILEVAFLLPSADPKTLQKEARGVVSKRLVKYPSGIKCPGSFFKNLVASDIPTEILKNIPPEKIVYGKLPAGALLEEVGAKGQYYDGIKIADYHANLFINTGQGTAWAFYELAKKYAQKVKEKFGITLEPEVQLINLPPML